MIPLNVQVRETWSLPSNRPIPENILFMETSLPVSHVNRPLLSHFHVLLIFSGSEHKELQIPTLAVFVKLQHTAPSTADRHAVTKQLDGTMVAHALSHAASL